MSLIVSRGVRRLVSVLAVLVAAVALAACSTGAAGAGGNGPVRTIKHEMGSTEISGEPHRVVALEYSFVQALDSLGVEPVGIADDDEPARIEQLLGKKVDYQSVGTRLEPNLELVANLQPDLIVADLTRHSKIADQLEQIAPTIVLNSWEGSYDDIKNAVVTIADALGHKADGESAVKAHEAKMADLAARIPAGEKRRYLLAVATPDGMSLHTSAAFTGSVFKALGLTPALDGTEATESGVGLERLVAVNPDVLFVATDGPGTVAEQWPSSPAWAAMSAAKNHLVFPVNRNQYARFRGLQTAEIIAGDIVQHLTTGS
jgi:ferric citrate transport system substrate-binding protein